MSSALTFLLCLAACGGGGGADHQQLGPATVSTLAYVVTECHGNANGGTIRQRLQIRQGDQTPITVVEHTSAIRIEDALSACQNVGVFRSGFLFTQYGAFHRLGVTPDGSQVVFEVTDDDAQTVFPPDALTSDQKGIFAVRADGTDLRRLGPASSESPTDPDARPFFVFSPNGRMVAYTDHGPSRGSQDAVQIFTLDVATRERRQVTQLSPAGPGGTYGPLFTDDQTIAFFTFATADGLNPAGELISATVKTTDPMHTLTVAPPPIAIPGSQVLPTFHITGSDVNVADLVLPGDPANGDSHPGLSIQEVFVIDRDNNVLQLTNFRRVDTFNPTLSADGQRVIFVASANPPELNDSNPSEDCQIFSIDRNGADLRQLTHFHEGPVGRHSTAGCLLDRPPNGCSANVMSRDTRSDALVFQSSCDPFGTNPYGTQLFAMHSDGTGLRQLTNTQGFTRDTTDGLTVEAVFPFAYPGLAIVYNYTPNR